MRFNEVYESERATRRFTNRKVLDRVLEEIVKEAQHSPSLLNSQPWRVYAVTGDSLSKIKASFKEKAKAGEEANEDFASMLSLNWDTFPSQNMATMGASQTYFFRNKMELFNKSNNEMFNAPAIYYLTIPKKSPAWSVFDLGIFAQSLMLCAINHELHVMPAHSLVSYPDVIHQYAGIPETEAISMGIAVGYKDRGAEVNDPKFFPPRLPLEKIYKLIK
ncbi:MULTISPECIES: nitroreductase [Lactobacillus]|uniref:Nitroreductase n=1 Tax=Lactobacillus xujianguonis TaxID=2495899 RepID=A0A437SWM4_9LACO|nr:MULTISPECIES: nitroreductase [Lactobacillus]RVU71331.1 nitroreductase [Lactobacillus xujianguonis]RVU74034.1 nitroreductase [Lactobacillus xujianguonis]